MSFVFWNNMPCVLGRDWIFSICWWKQKIYISFSFGPHTAFAFALFKKLSLDPKGFFHPFFFLFVLLTRGVMEWLGGHLASNNANPPQFSLWFNFPWAKPQPHPSLPLHCAVWSLTKEGLTHTTCYLIVKGENVYKVWFTEHILCISSEFRAVTRN